jgi:putative FmdB family regulatory protein
MPIYEYSCKKCGDFEVTQRMIEEPLKKCPTCGAKVIKLISQSAFHLKGSGWYVTDYAKNGTNKGSSDGKSSSDTKESSSTSSSSDTSATASTKESDSSSKEKTSPTKESAASA